MNNEKPTPHQKHVMLYHWYTGKLWVEERYSFGYTDHRGILGTL
jgi:hypothetical protein